MNKVIGILFILLFVNCKGSKESIQIIQKTTDYPITLRISPKYKKIIGIKFPQRIEIKNNSVVKESFIKIDYEYNSIPKERSYGITLYTENNNILTKVSNNKKKDIAPYGNLEFILYSRHFVDSSATIQNELKPYVARMLQLNQDTLTIGSLSEFKTKHAKLLTRLTQNDSISIRFFVDEKLGKRLSVPVKW